MSAVEQVKKITVAHLIPRIPFGGGAESLLLDICRSMDRTRFSMVVFYWADGEDLAQPLREAGATVVRLPLNKSFPFVSVPCLLRALKACRVDVLHTHFIDSDLLGFLSAWCSGIPMVMHVHSFPFPKTRIHAWRYKLMSFKIKKIICVSSYVEHFVMTATGISSDKFVMVPNGTDLQRFSGGLVLQEKEDLKRSLGIKAGVSVIGTVTRLEADKSVETWLRAVPLVLKRYPDARCLIVGDGSERFRLERMAHDLGLEHAVIFTGRRQDIPALLSIMNVFVITAVEEAFGLSLLEALAAGKPVVAANACALPDLVRNGEEGLLFRPCDENDLAGAVLRLLDDPALASHLAMQGVLRSREFTSHAMALQLEKVYDEVLARD